MDPSASKEQQIMSNDKNMNTCEQQIMSNDNNMNTCGKQDQEKQSSTEHMDIDERRERQTKSSWTPKDGIILALQVLLATQEVLETIELAGSHSVSNDIDNDEKYSRNEDYYSLNTVSENEYSEDTNSDNEVHETQKAAQDRADREETNIVMGKHASDEDDAKETQFAIGKLSKSEDDSQRKILKL